MEIMIEDLMEQLVELGGSDMHIQAGAPIYFRNIKIKELK